MANKKFKDGNTLDSSQIYDKNWNDNLSELIQYLLIGHTGFRDDLNTCTSAGVYPYYINTANTPAYGYGAVLNIMSWGATKTNNNWLWQIAFDTNNLIFIRTKINDGSWSSWKQIL